MSLKDFKLPTLNEKLVKVGLDKVGEVVEKLTSPKKVVKLSKNKKK